MSSSEPALSPASESPSSDPVKTPIVGGVVATFLSGLFAILPLVLTVIIVGWVAQKVLSLVGPNTHIGSALRSVGLRFVTDPWVAQAIGWAIVLVGIWFMGLLVRTRARVIFDRMISLVFHRIPIVKGVYGTASQVFRMLERREENELQGMSVVFCSFGQEQGAGFLCLLATSEVFRFDNRDYHIVYMPTSPLPMTGGIIFVPQDSIRPVPISVDKLMEIYFSMGILSPHAIPETHHKGPHVPEP
jgi:uncharacterized membrane protein